MVKKLTYGSYEPGVGFAHSTQRPENSKAVSLGTKKNKENNENQEISEESDIELNNSTIVHVRKVPVHQRCGQKSRYPDSFIRVEPRREFRSEQIRDEVTPYNQVYKNIVSPVFVQEGPREETLSPPARAIIRGPSCTNRVDFSHSGFVHGHNNDNSQSIREHEENIVFRRLVPGACIAASSLEDTANNPKK